MKLYMLKRVVANEHHSRTGFNSSYLSIINQFMQLQNKQRHPLIKKIRGQIC
jgi:hypothetical protein